MPRKTNSNRVYLRKLSRKSKLVNLQSLLRKLAYFNRATDEILRGNSKEATIRRQTTLKTKVSEAYGLIELIQCLKIDAGESDETIDEWTSENNGRLREYEVAIEELNRKLLDEEKIQREIERQEKIRQEVEARALIRHEEEPKNRQYLQSVQGRKSLHYLWKKRSWRLLLQNGSEQNYLIYKYQVIWTGCGSVVYLRTK